MWGCKIIETFENSRIEFKAKLVDDLEKSIIAFLNADISIKVAKYTGDDVDELMENYEFGYCSLVKATYRVLEKFRMENKIYVKITYI